MMTSLLLQATTNQPVRTWGTGGGWWGFWWVWIIIAFIVLWAIFGVSARRRSGPPTPPRAL